VESFFSVLSIDDGSIVGAQIVRKRSGIPGAVGQSRDAAGMPFPMPCITPD
jgi:hypothetical protein